MIATLRRAGAAAGRAIAPRVTALRATIVGRLASLRVWRERRRPPITVSIVDDEPARPAPRLLYVSLRGGEPAVGWLACPCGCRDVITLRLAGQRSPQWRLLQTTGPATLHPSVWRKAGCRSHFILRDGRVQWC